jgi:hypothetical protein
LRILNIIIIIALVLVIGGFALTYQAHTWIGHTIAAFISFMTAISLPILGAGIKGRIKKIKGANLIKLHRRIAIFFGLLVIGTFVYGLWMTSWRYGSHTIIPPSIHGRLGFTIVLVALLQVIPSLATKKRKKIRTLHRILGYAMPILMLSQVILGLLLAIKRISNG